MLFTDTILAPSSPTPAPGALRLILRLSGPSSHRLVRYICTLPATAARGHFAVSLMLPSLAPISAAILLFEAPHSFTGQDIAELHLPASPALLRLATDHLLNLAATHKLDTRLANPGEFSARAFFNQKLDLTQAEGLAATISATNAQELRAAASLRTGHLHAWTHQTADQLADLLARIEAGIDFTDEEDIRFISREQIARSAHGLLGAIHDQLAAALRIDRLDSPPTAVFIGKPNVGKSSLINALAGHERSIVSPIAGTTRDILAATLHSPRGDVRLLDVPGEEAPGDELRAKMMAARTNALLDADLIIEVLDAADALPTARPMETNQPAPTLRITNKSDLLPADHSALADTAYVSAQTGHHLPELRETLTRLLSREDPSAAHRLVLNHRHRALLQETTIALAQAITLAESPSADTHPELLAAELRHALDLLGQITGTISPDEVLGRIFSQFCIGK